MSEHTEPLSFNYCEFDTNLRKGKVKLIKKIGWHDPFFLYHYYLLSANIMGI